MNRFSSIYQTLRFHHTVKMFRFCLLHNHKVICISRKLKTSLYRRFLSVDLSNHDVHHLSFFHRHIKPKNNYFSRSLDNQANDKVIRGIVNLATD